MTEFIHSCHRAKINSGELVRLSNIIEAYRDKQGHIALTNQNERLFDYADQRITSSQQAAIIRGDRKIFGLYVKKSATL